VVRVTDISHRPTPLAAGFAVVLAGVATALLARTVDQRVAIAGAVLGMLALAGAGRWTDRGPPAWLWSVGGTALLVATLGVTATITGTVRRVELYPGLVGVVCLGLGVRPVSDRFARPLAAVGLATLVVGVALVGIFDGADPPRLLAAAVLALAAWDSAGHAVGLGQQLRTDAVTRPVELLHTGATLAYGGVLVGAALLVYSFGATDLSLSALVLLLGGAVTLLALLYS